MNKTINQRGTIPQVSCRIQNTWPQCLYHPFYKIWWMFCIYSLSHHLSSTWSLYWEAVGKKTKLTETSELITQMCFSDIKFLLLSPLVSVKIFKLRSRKLSRTWQLMINERFLKVESLEIMIFKERVITLNFWRYLKSLAFYYLVVLEKSFFLFNYLCSPELEKFKATAFDICLRVMFEENSLLPITVYLHWNLKKLFPKWVSEYK